MLRYSHTEKQVGNPTKGTVGVEVANQWEYKGKRNGEIEYCWKEEWQWKENVGIMKKRQIKGRYKRQSQRSEEFKEVVPW